jgi:antitoxin CptB
MPDDTRRRRLLFRAQHRGTKECDILIGGFVAARLWQFSENELSDLEIMLEQPDPLLADWLTGRRPIPDDISSPMLHAMRRAALGGV